MQISKDLDLAIEAARRAGEIIKKGYGHIKTISEKERKGIVTDVDKTAEDVIIKTLKASSNYSFLSEESGYEKGISSIRWVIDPLDGTTNFSRQIPLFAVSIALMEGNSIILGVILNPITNEFFFAEKNKGAFLNDKKITVSSISSLKQGLVFVNRGYSLEAGKNLAKLVNRLVNTVNLRTFGSTALELCQIALGSAEVFLSSFDELWDYAAGILIVEEASGKVTDWKGKNWNNSNSFVFASNGLIHNQILENIKGLQ